MIKWFIGLATTAALAWFFSVSGDDDARPPAPLSSPSDELPQTARPAVGKSRQFSVAEIRWCMGQEVRLDAVRPRLATRRAIDRHNEDAADYNRRCNGYKSSASDREEARRDVDAAREQIVAAALEDFRPLNEEGALTTRRAQELLELLGYNPGAIDGVYGRRTKTAIESFQREEGLSVDGLLSEELSDHLGLALARRATGRSGPEKPARHVVIRVVEATQGAVSEAEAVPDAEVTISGDRDFNRIQLTNERGTVEFPALPAGALKVSVRRNGGTFRYTSQLQITQEPHQQIFLTLPPR